MISSNSSDWLIPITQCYFYIIYIWAYNSGMQIEDLVPFNTLRLWQLVHEEFYNGCLTNLTQLKFDKQPL